MLVDIINGRFSTKIANPPRVGELAIKNQLLWKRLSGRDCYFVCQESEGLIDALLQGGCVGIKDQVGVLRNFVWGADARVVLDFPLSGEFVIPFYVTGFADFNRTVHVDEEKVSFFMRVAKALLHLVSRRDERAQADGSCVHEQFVHFADASDILRSVFRRKGKVAAQTLSDVVSVKSVGIGLHVKKALFHGVGMEDFPDPESPVNQRVMAR